MTTSDDGGDGAIALWEKRKRGSTTTDEDEASPCAGLVHAKEMIETALTLEHQAIALSSMHASQKNSDAGKRHAYQAHADHVNHSYGWDHAGRNPSET